MPPLPPALLRSLLRAAVRTRPDEMSCGDCYEALGAFAEAYLDGTNAEEAMPLVAEHLRMCHECEEEFRALLDGLRAVGAAPARSWTERLGIGRPLP